MIIAHVIPLTRSIDAEMLSYFSARMINPGTLVTVPLRKQQIKALVVKTQTVTDMKSQLRGATYQIRNIIQIHDEQIFSESFLNTCNLLKNYYATTTGRVINTISPKIVTKNIELFTQPITILKTPGKIVREKILQQPLADRVIYYKTLVREKMIHKESIHIICPTQKHAEYIYQQVSNHIADICFLFHGGLTKKQTLNTYEFLKKHNSTSLVISTIGFIDVPQNNLTTIVIEDESSEYYTQITSPYIDNRLFAVTYAAARNIECIWASHCIRPETWHRQNTHHTEIIEPIQKRIFKTQDLEIIRQHTKPTGKLTDQERIEEITKSSGFTLFSDEAKKILDDSIKNKEKIFLFVPKKSLAPSIICSDCGNMARSAETGHPLSLYTKRNPQTRIKERIFICHMTGESMPAFDQCQFCQGYTLIPIGIGTETVAEYIATTFPDVTSVIIDGSHTKTKKDQRAFAESFTVTTDPIVVIGTTKALSLIQDIDRTIIISMDSYFSHMDYAVESRIVNLLGTIIQKTKKPVVLQSRNILEEMIPILTTGLYSPYIQQELTNREKYEYPPFATIIKISKTLSRGLFKKYYMLMQSEMQEYNYAIFTKPGKKKDTLNIHTVITLPNEQWNMNYQHPALQQWLYAQDRLTQIHINPTHLS